MADGIEEQINLPDATYTIKLRFLESEWLEEIASYFDLSPEEIITKAALDRLDMLSDIRRKEQRNKARRQSVETTRTSVNPSPASEDSAFRKRP